MTVRPCILISRAEDVLGERWEDYADCIERAGGDPLPFDIETFEGIDALPAHGGIVITAGVDIHPARYGQERSDRIREVDPRRDEVEEALITHALENRVPLFCICRGFQLLNTSRGGSLLQHLADREPHRARRGEDGVSIVSGWHDVEVRPGTLLAEVTGAERLHVNSRHHQAVLLDGVAPVLQACGMSSDGVVEALEVSGHPWALGVQWHPERTEMTDDPVMAPGSTWLFEAFVTACGTRMERP
jgi:putative glutamine amidotransferase